MSVRKLQNKALDLFCFLYTIKYGIISCSVVNCKVYEFFWYSFAIKNQLTIIFSYACLFSFFAVITFPTWPEAIAHITRVKPLNETMQCRGQREIITISEFLNLTSFAKIRLVVVVVHIYPLVTAHRQTLTIRQSAHFLMQYNYFVLGGICTCLAISSDPMFLNSFPRNLLLVRSHQAETFIVKRLIQRRNNVIRVWVDTEIMRL